MLDIMMPVMTGHEVLQCLNADGRIHTLPVIVISALSEVDDIAACIEAGAEDFLLKPFNRTLLRARVLSSLEKKFLRDQTRLELQRKQAELAEARTLQLALAPAAISIEAACGTVSIDLVLDPAREVGGDLVDHFLIGGDLLVAVLGDVSDKGAGAALMMARTCALLRGLGARPDAKALFTEPGQAMAALNAALARNNPSCMFVTMLLASLDLASGRLRYVRAGHVPPFLRYADGGIARLGEPGGVPPGVMEDARYTSHELTLAPGDQMLVITDGITEATSPDGRMFGDEGTAAWLSAPSRQTSLVSGLVAEVRRHEAGAPPSDDVAALMLSLSAPRPEPAPLLLHDQPLQPQPDEISTLVDKVMELLERRGVDHRCAHHTGLMLDELLTNLGKYGQGLDKTCGIRLWLTPVHVRIVIEDRTEAFDLRKLPAPDTGAALDARTPGGLGAHLVLTLAQRYDYASTGGLNTTTLVIARNAAANQEQQER
ncbi:ATP-binding SpoIIE family protein phosphatase [Pigmentiphaga humi]